MRRLASLSLFVALVVPSLSAHAQTCAPSSPSGWAPGGSTPGCVPLNNNLGGPAGFGTNVLPANDDGSTGAIDLTVGFPGGLHFFGHQFTTAYINNNGNITFGGTLGTYTPQAFPLSGGVPYPMLAPYWADVDTRQPTSSGGTPAPNHDLVYWDIRLGQFTITWFDVGYFSTYYAHRMSFQMIIRNSMGCGAGDFDVEFRYNTCQWIGGTASGCNADGHGAVPPCVPAQVGFDAHDGTNFVSIPESLTANVENVCVMSNVGMPGIYHFQVRGGSIVCAGGGTSCMVPGQMGACAVGVNACHGAGVRCQQVTQPTPEICDNIDNDCDGLIDEGGGLCPGSTICVNGTCITSCLDGGCAMGFTCQTNGHCVEDACVPVTCPANQRCVHGSCVDSCTGVVCPHGQQCLAGQCIDLCHVLTCDSGYVCQNGQCVSMCPCNPCPTGQVCNADGTCSPSGCDVVTCPTGMYCDQGMCLDACAGVTCPANQTCITGMCVLNGSPDAGNVDAAIVYADTGIHPADGSMRGVDGGGDSGRGGPHVTHAGCGCRVESGRQGLGGYVLFGLALLALVRRRRGARS